MKKEILHQEADDRLVIITKGEYSGHEGVMRKLESGEMAVLVLEKNSKMQGPVKVIDIIKFEIEAVQDPHLH